MEQHVISFIHRVWGSKDRFPGPQPVSIERRHFPLLRDNLYVVCEKTDGERYMLVAMRWQGQPLCVLVNRAFRMFQVQLNLPKAAYDGTVLDGELYENNFMVYDGVAVSGNGIAHLNFLDRYASLEQFIKRIICMKSDPYKVRLKTFHACTDFEEFQNTYLPTVSQRVDGVGFTPVD